MTDRDSKGVIIVTRHKGLIEWLARQGLTGTIMEHVAAEDVSGREVVGVLPYHLAVLASRVGVVDMPFLTVEQRGKDLTPEEMDAAGAALHWYKVSF